MTIRDSNHLLKFPVNGRYITVLAEIQETGGWNPQHFVPPRPLLKQESGWRSTIRTKIIFSFMLIPGTLMSRTTPPITILIYTGRDMTGKSSIPYMGVGRVPAGLKKKLKRPMLLIAERLLWWIPGWVIS